MTINSSQILEELSELEKSSKLLDPNQTTRANWLQQVDDYVTSFLSDLPNNKAYNKDHSSIDAIEEFDIEEKGASLNQLLTLYEKSIDGVGINPASGGHMGYIPGGGAYPSALGDYLAAVSNRYAGIFYAAPGAVKLENMLIKWMCRLMGFPENATGNLTSGGSISNLIAIVTARDAAKVKAKDFDKLVIYISEQAHHSIQKAIRIAGLSEAVIRYVPLDSQLRMSVEELARMISEDESNGLIPFIINASLGTTNTGAIDPINEIADCAEKHGLWFHVDAAYGGFFKLLPEMEEAFKGINRASSITLDPHKTLFLPFGTGAVLVKDVKSVYQSHHYLADYMQDTANAQEEISPADVSPELTKHFRGLRLWFPLKLFGLEPFRAALKEKLLLCRYFYNEVHQIPNIEVGPTPELSVAIFRYLPEDLDANKFNQKLINEIQSDGKVFLSSTTINGIFWIRVAVVLFRTHLNHIEYLLEDLKKRLA